MQRYWVYYKEQCNYCSNRDICDYKEKVNQYIKELENLDSRGIYGTTSFWCDYYNLDGDVYWKNHIGECNEAL